MKQQGLVTKAVFPVAGWGTRFLPATKAIPKEMLPIVDKPLIQYAVEEAIDSGINELFFVTNSDKRSIQDHFDRNSGLEAMLFEQGNIKLLEQIKNFSPPHVNFSYVRQSKALGLGHAILQVKNLINNQPFAVLLPDDLIDSEGSASCLRQMLHHYSKVGGTLIAVEHIPLSDTEKYGIIQVDANWQKNGRIKGIIEKPAPEYTPSQLAVIGRYILEPTIFECLEQVKPGRGGEIQLTDGIELLLNKQSVHAMEFIGTRYDCGSKLGYLQATIRYALRHPEVKEEVSQFLKKLVAEELGG